MHGKAQIVMAVGVLILSAAFLLLGLYFAQLQGLFFQNGANSLQLFANNLAAVKNALYMAPSSMTITLAGNSSLCNWNPSTDYYSCSGGSIINNLSYATGPTIDTGHSVFSIALCFVGGLGPKFGSSLISQFKGLVSTSSEVADEAAPLAQTSLTDFMVSGGESEATSAATAIGKGAQLYNNLGSQLSQASEKAAETAAEDGAPEAATALEEEGQTKLEEFGIGVTPPSSWSQILGSYASRLGVFLKNSLVSVGKRAIINLALNGGIAAGFFGVGAGIYWLFDSPSQTYNSMSHGVPVDAVVHFPSQVLAEAGTLLSAYQTSEPISTSASAFNLELQNLAQLTNFAGETAALNPASIYGANAQTLFANSLLMKSDILNQLLSDISSFNPSSTPMNGINVPATLSSSNAFISPVSFSSSGDPSLSSIFGMAQIGFLTVARTASCMGDVGQLINPSSYTNGVSAATNLVSVYGAVSSLFNIYGKVKSVEDIGSYFVGYGGEAYVNGQANGRPTEVGASIVTDLSDMCSIAENSYQGGVNLRSGIFPAGNGSLSFSINQGLFNTQCSSSNPLFPETLNQFINNMINSGSSSVSISLPPQYAIGFSGSLLGDVCIYRLMTDSAGSPIYVTNKIYTLFNKSQQSSAESAFVSSGMQFDSYNIEYGIPVSCANVSNLTANKYTITFPSPLTAISGASSLQTLAKNVIVPNSHSSVKTPFASPSKLSWSSPVTITSSAYTLASPQARSPIYVNGYYYAFWEQSNGVLYYASSSDGASFSVPKTAVTAVSTNRLATGTYSTYTDGQKVYIAYATGSFGNCNLTSTAVKIYVVTGTPSGGSINFGSPVQLTSASGYMSFSFTNTSNGDLFLGLSDCNPSTAGSFGDYHYYIYDSKDFGVSWAQIQDLTPSTGYAPQIGVAALPDSSTQIISVYGGYSDSTFDYAICTVNSCGSYSTFGSKTAGAYAGTSTIETSPDAVMFATLPSNTGSSGGPVSVYTYKSSSGWSGPATIISADSVSPTLAYLPGYMLLSAILASTNRTEVVNYSFATNSWGSPATVTLPESDQYDLTANDFGSKGIILEWRNSNDVLVTIGSVSKPVVTPPAQPYLTDGDGFFINNDSIVGFSIKASVYPNNLSTALLGGSLLGNYGANIFNNPYYIAQYALPEANYIVANQYNYSFITGVDSPALSFVAGIFRQQGPKLELQFSSAIIDDLINAAMLRGIAPPNYTFYQASYANVTFNVNKYTYSGGNPRYAGMQVLNITFLSNRMIFGVYPNAPQTNYLGVTLGGKTFSVSG